MSFRPGVLRAAAQEEAKSFKRTSSIMFLVPFVSPLVLLVVVLMRT